MALPEAPNSRSEQYLAKIAGQETELPEAPNSRVEQYLEYIAENGTVSEEKIAEKVSTWLEENIHEDPTVVIDASLSVSGAAADAKAAGDEISDLKADLRQNYSKIVESDAIEPDLDISDPSGNVLVRLQDGHIQTKEFDSADVIQDIADLSSGKIDIQQNVADAGKALVIGIDGAVSPADVSVSVDDTLTQEGEAADAKAVGDALANIPAFDIIKDTDSTTADLYLCDYFGNVIVEFANGHILSKNFDSSDFEDIPDDVVDLQNDVLAIQNKTNGIMYRTKNQTDGVYAICRWHQPNSASKQFCILAAGDIHTDPTRMVSMIEFLNAVDAFDAGIMLGDISGNTFSDSISYYTDAITQVNKPFLTVIGNHDVGGATSDSDLWTKYGDCFQYAELASGESVSGKCYYFKDFTTYKIRVIVLMQYDYTYNGNMCFGQSQINWLINVLQNTPYDYGVIIAEHTNASRYMTYHMDTDITSETWKRSNYAPTYMDGDPVPDIINAWINGSTLNHTYSYTYDNPPEALSVSADFTSRGAGEFITYLGGHWHMDVLGYPTNYADQMDYHVPAAGLSAATQGDMPRKAGTTSEDSFCAIAIDRDNKTVKVMHIGAHFTKDAIDRQCFRYVYGGD